MIRLPLVLLLGVTGCMAQAPALDAAEVAAYRAARNWQQNLAIAGATGSDWAWGFERLFFGFDKDGQPGVGIVDTFDREQVTVVIYYRRRASLLEERMLMANSLGEVFLGQAPAGIAPDWQPRLETVSADGEREEPFRVLRQSGTARDGTSWQRVQALEGDVTRPQRVRFVRSDGGSLDDFEFTIGSSPFRWHPGWLPLAPGTALSLGGPLAASGGGEAVAVGRGIPARGLQLQLRRGTSMVVLEPGDVRAGDHELLVTVRPDAMVEAARLDDQAWAAEVLRQFAALELAARDRVALDHDGDGRGEFGEPGEVVPQNRLSQLQHTDGLWQFHEHLFRVHLPDGVDEREQRFVAYAWPVAAVERRDLALGPAAAVDHRELAFAVDQRGVVFACSVHRLLTGGVTTPPANAIDVAEVGWHALH